jgi:hypothetical protein
MWSTGTSGSGHPTSRQRAISTCHRRNPNQVRLNSAVAPTAGHRQRMVNQVRHSAPQNPDICANGVPSTGPHTYPPPRTEPIAATGTPPNASTTPPPPNASTTPPPPFSPLPPPQYQITKFILRPGAQETGKSLISRTLAKFRRTISFVLCPIPPEVATVTSQTPETVQAGQELSPTQLLSFVEDHHSTASSVSGTLRINEGLAANLGVEVAFWIAVTLAYWEYLGEREVSCEALVVLISPHLSHCRATLSPRTDRLAPHERHRNCKRIVWQHGPELNI